MYTGTIDGWSVSVRKFECVPNAEPAHSQVYSTDGVSTLKMRNGTGTSFEKMATQTGQTNTELTLRMGRSMAFGRVAYVHMDASARQPSCRRTCQSVLVCRQRGGETAAVLAATGPGPGPEPEPELEHGPQNR